MKQVKPFIYLISAFLISIILIPFGVVYNIGKSIKNAFMVSFMDGLIDFIAYWFGVIHQIFNALKYLSIHIAISLDLLWNATSGELIEDCITAKENTLFGSGDITVSAATGELELKGELVPFGKKFTVLLSLLLGKNHSIVAYKKMLYENAFKQNNS